MRYVLPVVLFLLQVAVPVSADDSMYINGSKWVSPSRDTNKDRTYTTVLPSGDVVVTREYRRQDGSATYTTITPNGDVVITQER